MSLWPLRGVQVLDASTAIAGMFCGRVLADAGARVVKVELPAGADASERPSQGWCEFLDEGKDVCQADPATGAGRQQLEELLAASQLYVTTSLHADVSPWNLDCHAVLERHDELVSACVTPFGQSGPYVSYAADDVVVSALSGLADATPGFPDRREHDDEPPVQSRAPLTEIAGGITASGAIFGALLARLRHGIGPRHVEVSSLEATVAMMVWEWGLMAYGGFVQGRRPRPGGLEPNCILPCRDGIVILVAFSDRQWEILLDLMGNPEWASSPAYRDAERRVENWQALHEDLRTWSESQSGLDILEAAQSRGLPCGPYFELRDVLETDHVQEIGSVRAIGGRRFPADAVVVNGARRTRPTDPVTMLKRRACRDEPSPCSVSPLSGLRVLDLSQYLAGPFAGQSLAALGAEVILVESGKHVPSRRFAPFAGEPKHDGSMFFNHTSRGKESVLLDLTTADGRAVLRKLVASSDVVLENFSRRAAERLGLTYAELVQEREDIILASISAFGRQGGWGGYVALHSGIILMSGLASVTKDEEGRPRLVTTMYPDVLTGAYLAIAVQQAVAERELTGRGCEVEVSMLDVMLTSMGGLVPEAHVDDGATSGPARFLRTAEPAGFLAVSETGIGGLDIEAEVVRKERDELMAGLQSRGLKAAAVLDMAEVIASEHLHHRRFVIEDDHPVAGRRPLPAVPWLYDGVRPELRHAPCFGAATDDVLMGVAELSADDVAALRDDGVLS
ncbi:MAG: CoA transferase [Actinomycetia bacterium]|nr:CoA transferase [Actinomycetes bacterium]